MSEVLPSDLPGRLGDTIGGVLTAIVDAQRMAAESTLRFIEEAGFTSGGPGGKALQKASFRFQKLDENQNEHDFILEVPLLSLVKIPAIEIKKATIRFSYDVVATGPPDPSKGGPSKVVSGKLPAIWGKVSRQSKDPVKTHATLDVEIEIQAADPASGMSRLLDALELAASEKKA